MDQGIKMEVRFKRRLVNELLTTYLPSFLLLGICYATTHFKPFYFEAVVTVNLTVMLGTTTLFIRLISIGNNWWWVVVVWSKGRYSSWAKIHRLKSTEIELST